MGFFGSKEKEEDILLKKANKYVETVLFKTRRELDIAIAERMKKRIIKDIQYQTVPNGNASPYFSAMLIYDHFKEKIRDEKEQGIGIER